MELKLVRTFCKVAAKPVLIVPLWNWNKIDPAAETTGPMF